MAEAVLSLPCVIDGFLYRLASTEECEAVTELVAHSFSTEPSTLHCRLGEPFSLDSWRKFVGVFLPSALEQDLVVVASSPEDYKKLVGAFVLRDFLSGFPEEITAFTTGTKVEHVLRAVGTLDDKWAEAHASDLEEWQNAPGKVVDLWMLAVAQEALGRGISNNLTKLSLTLAARRNFELAVIECTGFFSQSAAMKSGLSKVCELDYLDYVVDGETPFSSVPAPHSKWVLFEKKLQQV